LKVKNIILMLSLIVIVAISGCISYNNQPTNNLKPYYVNDSYILDKQKTDTRSIISVKNNCWTSDNYNIIYAETTSGDSYSLLKYDYNNYKWFYNNSIVISSLKQLGSNEFYVTYYHEICHIKSGIIEWTNRTHEFIILEEKKCETEGINTVTNPNWIKPTLTCS